MDATSQPSTDTPTAHRRKWGGRRVTGLLVGLVLALCSLGLIGGGAYATWAATSGTYVDLGANGSYRSDRYGLATDGTNWRSSLFGWAGSVRLEVAPASAKPIFVGVGKADTVDQYLSGTAYTTIREDSDHDRTDHDGAAPKVPAAGAVEWTAHAEGAGTQTLRWDATEDAQVAFAMNSDGSRPVHIKIVSSAVTLDRMPWWAPTGLLVLGVILLPAGGVLTWRTARSR